MGQKKRWTGVGGLLSFCKALEVVFLSSNLRGVVMLDILYSIIQSNLRFLGSIWIDYLILQVPGILSRVFYSFAL